MKIHNVLHLNLLQKTSINPLTGQVDKLVLPIIINNETFLMLEVIEVKYKIGVGGLAEIRTGNCIMLLDLIIL